MAAMLTATEAAARLGVSRQTLYAYVSRGMLSAHGEAGGRESRYLQADVERLAETRRRGRRPREIARATLDFGLPVLESAITLIEGGDLYYRGARACDLARDRSAEAVAALLWQMPEAACFAAPPPILPACYGPVATAHAGQPIEARLLALFTLASADAGTAEWQRSEGRLAAGCGELVRLMAACLLGSAPSAAPLHLQCAHAHGLDAVGADLVRVALVLCADHELNASNFTARCVASTGASLRAAVIGGLAALTGGRHGAATARVEALWDEVGTGPQAPARLRLRLARGEDLPGFGHHLYPAGDVRAALLLEPLLATRDDWRTLVDTAVDLTGQRPTIDFALVALRRHLGLPAGSAFGLFALGRTLGWIAHGMEQRAQGALIRPRAAYTGPMPQA